MDHTTTTAAERVCPPGQHDLEQVFTLAHDLLRVLCTGCGKSWNVTPAPADDAVGYVVVATTSDRPETAQWMTPARRDSIERAEADRAFWADGRHLKGAGLRLAKLVLLPDAPSAG